MARPSAAHELWLEPQAYGIDPGEAIAADIRIGDRFDGIRFPFVPKRFTRAEHVSGNGVAPIDGTVGDYPALRIADAPSGLSVLVYETTAQHITYFEREKFDAFLAYKDATWVAGAHAERGLPDTGFTERYFRFAKNLIAIGDGRGMDHAMGLELELVALGNPYTDDVASGLPVRVLYRDEPLADVQVTVFTKRGPGDVDLATVRTDGDGIANVPTQPGASVLVDTVVIRAINDGADGTDDTPVWESLWASLTFAVLDRTRDP